MKSSLPIWRETAEKLFSHTKEADFVKRGENFDKIITDCAFRENLRRKVPDSSGGCEDFSTTLTTNGICYTFNGKEASELWKPSEMITTFTNIFPPHSRYDKTFGGSRTVQGKLDCSVLQKQNLSKIQ